jgi:AraC family transcriptional regulator of adaptative response / DNA-3-methyladenine glycosylase II
VKAGPGCKYRVVTTYSAVVTTGIYCQPGCAGRPLAQNVRTFDHPAAAEAAGFRACHRCRPYWEGLIHVVDRVGLLLGAERDHSAGVAALGGDPMLGPW